MPAIVVSSETCWNKMTEIWSWKVAIISFGRKANSHGVAMIAKLLVAGARSSSLVGNRSDCCKDRMERICGAPLTPAVFFDKLRSSRNLHRAMDANPLAR